MRNVLKALNDYGPCEIRALDESALRRFEALCESWAKIAEAEIARRNALPQSPPLRHSIPGSHSESFGPQQCINKIT
jgi:hypothetical protein